MVEVERAEHGAEVVDDVERSGRGVQQTGERSAGGARQPGEGSQQGQENAKEHVAEEHVEQQLLVGPARAVRRSA
jgi:hypothetical protein